MKCGRLIQRTDLTSLLQVRRGRGVWAQPQYTHKEGTNGNVACERGLHHLLLGKKRKNLRSLENFPLSLRKASFFNLFHNRIHLKHLQPLSVPHLSQAEEQASGMDFIKQSGAAQEPRKLSPPLLFSPTSVFLTPDFMRRSQSLSLSNPFADPCMSLA